MRDHRKLRAFELADELALLVYRTTESFPRHEQFGLTSQMRRAAVSVACNIVEGCARYTEAEFLRFLDMAYGSSRELEYQASLAARLGYLQPAEHKDLSRVASETVRVIAGLIRSFRQRPAKPSDL